MQGLGKYKNALAIIGVIVIAFFVVRSIYDYHAAIIANFEKERAEIVQLGELIKTWEGLNKSIFHFKAANTHKDEAELKQFVEYCAQSRNLDIVKLSPNKEDKKIYLLAKIDLTVTIPNYSSLVAFVNDLEVKKVAVSRIRIQRVYQQQQAGQRVVDLSLTAYLPKTEETK
jgi:hypothetical protein